MQRSLSIAFVGFWAAVLGAAVWSSDSDRNSPTPGGLRDPNRWRALGPAGLEAVLKIAPSGADIETTTPTAIVREWRALVDAVAGQHDAWASKLYWYTDLEEAKAAAQATGKPILSLRLLGKLTDEYSCANSRFFRKTLYPNAEVGHYLRENFILHWESVRPVPIVTIDFGDGRTLKRTITGNSIHYVLDAQGRIVDALPGLYGPQAFLAGLQPAHEMAVTCGRLEEQVRQVHVAMYHDQRLRGLESRLDFDLQRAGVPADEAERLKTILTISTPAETELAPLRTAVAERDVRVDLMTASIPSVPDRSLPIWEKLAALHHEDIRRDPAAMRVVAPGVRPVNRANALAIGKNLIEAPVVEHVQLIEFNSSRALDTVYNEYAPRRKIHRTLREALLLDQPLEKFTEWCYAELFLSSLDDPWYGLKPEVYGGFDDEPVTDQTAQVDRRISRPVARFRQTGCPAIE